MKLPNIRQNKLYFFLMLLSDFFFLFSLSSLAMLYLTPIISRLADASDILKDELSSISLEDLSGVNSLLASNSDFMSLYHEMLLLLAELAFLVLVVWILFKSLSWYFSHKSFLKSIPFLPYVGKFALLSLFWFACSIIAILLSLFIGRFASQLSPFILLLFALAILYFSQIHFALIPHAKNFKSAFFLIGKKRLLLAFIINLIVLLIAFWVWSVSVKFSAVLGFFVLFALPLPVLAFCRFHIIFSSWQKS